MSILQPELVQHEQFEYVEFRVGKNHFAIGINHVREIIEPVPITVLPHLHPFIEGIIQLRGEVIPVVDLKKVTGNNCTKADEEAKFIISELDGTTIGLDVSAVTQIERINFSEIENASDTYEGHEVPITGVIKRGNKMILLVDFEKVVAEQLK
ncbi:chemotaxis protein CheW [Sporosarcina sp. CAU 1771]